MGANQRRAISWKSRSAKLANIKQEWGEQKGFKRCRNNEQIFVSRDRALFNVAWPRLRAATGPPHYLQFPISSVPRSADKAARVPFTQHPLTSYSLSFHVRMYVYTEREGRARMRRSSGTMVAPIIGHLYTRAFRMTDRPPPPLGNASPKRGSLCLRIRRH